jgi:uncharacterized protein (TIGR01777 family)
MIMKKTVLITGATGMIGGHLINRLQEAGYDYIALTTNAEAAEKKLSGAKKITAMDDFMSLKDEPVYAAINLAGSNLGGKRWTQKNKKEFYDSRIQTTGKLIQLFEAMAIKPRILVSSSGVDYYGDTGSADMFENAPPAKSFLGRLTNDWEQAALKAEVLGIRVVVLRTGFVIAEDSEAVKKLLLPVKLFVGGPLGSGKQYVSWIHIDDLTGMYLFVLGNEKLKGIFNAAAPHPVTNSEFTKHAAKILGRPAFMAVPSFIIKAILGEMSAVVLEGRRAMPNKIVNAGYRFKFEHDVEAWKAALK